MKRLIYILSLYLSFAIFINVWGQDIAVSIDIHGPIGPALSDYVARGIEKAGDSGATLIILNIDTPGGLGTSMREIIKAILSSNIPVVGYVSPSGARAASAGTYILYACHVAAMSPGTNIGAASPVNLFGGILPGGKESGEAMKHKVENDVLAYIRSLAQLRKRNVKWAESAVIFASTLTATEALKRNVIDVVAEDTLDLLRKINGLKVNVLGKEKKLKITETVIQTMEPDWRYKFLSTITSPSIAYILLLMGVYGLFFEFSNPGLIVPGVVGGISLVIAMYSLQMLPISYAGLGLIVLGIIFSVAEVFVPSFGALGIGGIVAFIVGSILLFDTDIAAFRLAYSLIVAMLILNVSFAIFVIGAVIRSQYRKVVSGKEWLFGQMGTVFDDMDKVGLAKIKGELWKIQSDYPMKKGDKIKVMNIEGLTLYVRPIKRKIKKGE